MKTCTVCYTERAPYDNSTLCTECLERYSSKLCALATEGVKVRDGGESSVRFWVFPACVTDVDLKIALQMQYGISMDSDSPNVSYSPSGMYCETAIQIKRGKKSVVAVKRYYQDI